MVTECPVPEPTHACVRYLLELLNLPWLTNNEHDWFFSDWVGERDRTLGERLHDLLTSRAVERWADRQPQP